MPPREKRYIVELHDSQALPALIWESIPMKGYTVGNYAGSMVQGLKPGEYLHITPEPTPVINSGNPRPSRTLDSQELIGPDSHPNGTPIPTSELPRL